MKKWVTKELCTADFGDKRLVKRMEMILERLAESPMASIKSAFKGWAEVMAAYRFFDNKKVNVEGIFKPHRDKTLERIKEFDRVLFIQDTTELDYSSKKKLEGTGQLSILERQGFFAHNQFITTPENLPLGVWDAKIYARNEDEHGKAENRKQKPISEKESFRWLKGYRAACELKKMVPDVEVIACGDRENDIYEVFQEWNQRKNGGHNPADWLIRCNQNRALQQAPKSKDKNGNEEVFRNIREKIYASPILGSFPLRVKHKIQQKKVKRSKIKVERSAREAIMEVRMTRVTLRPPFRKGERLFAVTFNVVAAREKIPPKGEDPVEWILLTSLNVIDYESALDIIRLYAARWEIEVFHRVLKTGCKIEELQLKKDDRTKVAIALYMIVAWRVMYVTKLGRECPALPCDVIFDEDEWQALWVIVHDGHHDALAQKPSLGEFVNKIAEFGGFLNRKGDGLPGHQAIWQGLKQLEQFTIAWRVFVKKQGFKALKTNS